MTSSHDTDPTPIPGKISYKSVLAQDFVTSDGVVVDRAKKGQVGVFRNPDKRNAVEALVLSNYGGTQGQLFYLARARTVTGWAMKPVLKGGSPITATQVLALANTAGGVEGFYVDERGKLQHIELRGDAWTAPVAVDEAPQNLCELRVVYSPGANSTSGTVVLYAGQRDPDVNTALTVVFLYIREGLGKWTGVCLKPGGLVSSWALTMTSANSWLLTVLAKSNFTLSPKYHQPNVSILQGQCAWLSGTLGPGANVIGGPMNKSVKLAAMSHDNAGVGGTKDTMLVGLDAQADARGGHAVRWVVNPTLETSPTGAVPGTSFTDVSVVGSTAGLVTVYGVDPQMNLFVMRQTAYNLGDMGTSFGDTQTWGPVFQLDVRMARMYPDCAISDTPAIIAVDADIGALHLYIMDPSTNLWLAKPITLPSTRQYEITTWQTDITALDDRGAPLLNYDLDLRADSATDLLVNAEYHVVTSTTSARIRTNELGKLLVSSLAASLAPPAFVLSGASVPPQASCSPGASVNEYFVGTGSILGKPQFSPDAVKQMSPGKGLSSGDAAKAHKAIQQCALLGQQAGSPMAKAMPLSGPRYHVYARRNGVLMHHASVDEQEAHDLACTSAASVWSDVWDKTKHFAGDVWHAIENGVHAVESLVVDLARKAITIVVKIGDTLVRLADWVIDTLEAGLHAIGAVLNWIKVTIEKAIEWLKALFDFKAIWHTKEALASQLHALPEIVTNAINRVSSSMRGFVGATKEDVHRLFDPLIKAHQGKSFKAVQGFPEVGQAPSNEPLAGSVSAAEIVTNPSASWMQNKIVSNAPTDYAPPTSPADAADNFFSAIADVGDDLFAIFSDFCKGFTDLCDDPKNFSNILISSLLSLARDTLIAVLDVFDTFVQGLLALGEVAMKGITAVLDQELKWGFINDIYGWVARRAGGKSDKLTMCNLVALMAAFPVTITYKLIVGADQEPFPDGKLPPFPKPRGAVASASGDDRKSVYQGFRTTSGVLAIIGGGLVASCDLLGEPPTFLSVSSMITTALHTVMSMPEWVLWVYDSASQDWPAFVCFSAIMGLGAITLVPDAYRAYGGLKKKIEGKLKATESLKECDFGDVTKLALSIYGLVNLGWTTYSLVDNRYQPPLRSTASLVESLVSPFAVATIKPVRRLNIDGIPVGRIIQGCKVGLDLAAGVGGGALEISSAWCEE